MQRRHHRRHRPPAPGARALASYASPRRSRYVNTLTNIFTSTTFPPGSNDAEKALHASLVYVRCDLPYRVDSAQYDAYHGTGVVVDAARGLVLVDRTTVPTALSDITLSFANSIEVPGSVVFIHPIHNVAVVRYDPALLGDTPVKAARLAKERFA